MTDYGLLALVASSFSELEEAPLEDLEKQVTLLRDSPEPHLMGVIDTPPRERGRRLAVSLLSPSAVLFFAVSYLSFVS